MRKFLLYHKCLRRHQFYAFAYGLVWFVTQFITYVPKNKMYYYYFLCSSFSLVLKCFTYWYAGWFLKLAFVVIEVNVYAYCFAVRKRENFTKIHLCTLYRLIQAWCISVTREQIYFLFGLWFEIFRLLCINNNYFSLRSLR